MTGGLSTRIPRFRRTSIGGAQSSRMETTSSDTSVDDSNILNRSDSGLGVLSSTRNVKGNKLKRYHSIYERGEQKRESRQEKPEKQSPIQSPILAQRSKSPTGRKLNPLGW